MSSYEGPLTEGDFAKSTKKRLPICFCIDASGSMDAPTESGKTRMEELSEAFNKFVSAMQENDDVAVSADIAIIQFGGETQITLPFKPLKQFEGIELRSKYRSLTPIGDAIQVAIKLLEVRKSGYKQKGIKYFQPWLVVFTDGEPEGENAREAMEEAIAQTVELETQNKLVVFNIGIGSEVDVETLGRLSKKRKAPISVGTTDLGKLFEFLGSSSESIIAGGNVDDVLYGDTDLPVGEVFNVDDFSTPEVSNNSESDGDSENQDESAPDDAGDVDISEWCI